jgi:hypothetical protein
MMGVDQIKSKIFPCSSYDFSMHKFNNSIIDIFNFTDIKNVGYFQPLIKIGFKLDEK